MAINTQTFTALVRGAVAAVQGASSALLDFTVGSILLSVTEAFAGVAQWLQGLVLQVAAITRAATSSGSDLDSWVNDFGVTRLAAVSASGSVTFSRFTSTSQALIPVGQTVQTLDGSQQYAVTVDTTNSAYSASLFGYVLAAGVSSITVPVVALVAGSAANALAGQIGSITAAIPGVDTVTNVLTFTSGADAETDAALRLRFVAFINSLSRGTKAAIAYAISNVQPGLTYALVQNQTYAGATQYGYFYAVVDDGTGSPSTALLNSVAAAIEATRAFTVTYGVFGPTVENASVSFTAAIAAGYDPAATKALAAAAVQAYINALPLGSSLPYTRVAQVAYDASPGITNITGLLVNGATSDISATAQQVIKCPTTPTVS